ncbi:MAG: lipopolysaccharide heptosyltransferase I [Blastocatellia bacterium]|nr:lipopolysaccharide heptosyltransferase I [Blastocatellia bacterium]
MHFLIVKLSSIGDVVHTLPAVAALRQAYPKERITWVVERSASAILLDNPTIDQLIIIDTRRWRKNFWQPPTIQEFISSIKTLRKHPVDIALDFQGLLKSASIARLSRSSKILGFSNIGLREKASRFFLTDQIDINDQQHVIEKNLQLVASLGIDIKQPFQFPISVPKTDELYIDKLLENLQVTEFAIINPGGGWPTKLWSAEKFGQMADWLWENYKLPSLVTFGPGEENLAQRVIKASRSSHCYSVTTNLKQFVALARRATLFLGGDTGPLHLAAACQTPIVGIYGPTQPKRNGPFDKADLTVGLEDLACRVNCHRRRCPTNNECMDISLNTVAKAIEKRLSKTKLWQIGTYLKSHAAGVSH